MSLNAARSHDVLSSIIKAKSVSLEDVLILRRQIWPDGAISRGEAEMLFRIDAALEETCPEWTDLFTESVTSYVVDDAHPRGYVADADAAWLEQRILQDDYVNGATELELLVRVLERASHVPHRLEMLALETINTAVLTGDWKMVNNRALEKGILGDPEVSLLRRVVYARAGSQGDGVGRDEAEFLFALNDATAETTHCAAWTVLFVNAISNYLLSNGGYTAPPRERMKEIDSWLNRPGTGIGGFLLETLQGVRNVKMDTITAAFSDASGGDKTAASHYRLRAGDEQIDGTESRWLIDHLCRDSELSPNESALLVFLKAGQFQVDPSLESLIKQA